MTTLPAGAPAPLEPHVQPVSIDDLPEVPGVVKPPVPPEHIDLPPELPVAVVSEGESMQEQLIKQATEKRPKPEVVSPPEQLAPSEETPAPVPKKPQPTPAPAQEPAAQVITPPVSTKSETRKEIESILQSGLAEMYVKMTPQEQQAFSAAANETASKLETLMDQFKASAREVLRLIKAWLSKIPRVNAFFLEQASKIKTDEIIHLQVERKKQSRLIR